MIQSWKTRRRREIERRAESFGPVPINDSHTLFGNYPLTSTGIRVDNYSADCNYVFRRAIEIIAQNMAKISRHWRLKQTDAAGKRTNYTGIHHRLLTRQANNYTSAFSFWELLESWAKGWGNGYAWILRRNNLDPVWLYPLHPSRVSPRLVRGEDPENPWELIYQIDGGRATFLPYEMLHIKGNPGFDGVSGYNIVQLHENTLAISQAQGEFTGEFYKNGAVAGGLVELPAHLKADVVLKYQTDFQNKYASRGNRHMLALVDSGVKFTKTTVDPEVAQLLESRKFSIFEICLMVGVPPTVLGDPTSGTFSNTEQQQLALGTNTLHPIAECWRQEANMKLTPVARAGEDYEWEYDKALKALDAADTASKTAALHTAVGGPWMSKEEAREEDGLPEEVEGTIYPPPNMNAPPGQAGKGEGEKGAKGEGAIAAEGQNGQPTTEQLQDGVTQPTTRSTLHAPRPTVERRSLEQRDAVELSIAPVFADAAGRMAAKEAAAIAGYAKHLREGHPEQFEKRAAEFYARHAEHLKQAFEPGLWGLRSQIVASVKEEVRDSGGGDFELSDDAAAGAYAKALGDRHVEASQAALTAIMTGQQDPNAVADAIEARCQGLPSAIADNVPHEVRQASNYFARAAYRAAGCTQLRWMAHPEDPEECRALDGQVVSIDQPFASDPPRHHPPLTPGCRCGIAGLGNVVDLDNRADGKEARREMRPAFAARVERRAADGDPRGWITLSNDTHVFIGPDGTITKGAEGVRGHTLEDLKEHHSHRPDEHAAAREENSATFAADLAANKDLPDALRRQYQQAADENFAGMGPTALKEWKDRWVPADFFASTAAVDAKLKAAGLSRGGKAEGFVLPFGGKGKAYLNGGTENDPEAEQDLTNLRARVRPHCQRRAPPQQRSGLAYGLEGRWRASHGFGGPRA